MILGVNKILEHQDTNHTKKFNKLDLTKIENLLSKYLVKEIKNYRLGENTYKPPIWQRTYEHIKNAKKLNSWKPI